LQERLPEDAMFLVSISNSPDAEQAPMDFAESTATTFCQGVMPAAPVVLSAPIATRSGSMDWESLPADGGVDDWSVQDVSTPQEDGLKGILPPLGSSPPQQLSLLEGAFDTSRSDFEDLFTGTLLAVLVLVLGCVSAFF
jgi:hypothetical protein